MLTRLMIGQKKINFRQLSTEDLKEYIRATDAAEESAVLELCTRHDAGDLTEFLEDLTFRPVNTRLFVLRAKELGVPVRTTAQAISKSVQHVKNLRHEGLGGRPNVRVGTAGRTQTDICPTPVLPAGLRYVPLAEAKAILAHCVEGGMGPERRMLERVRPAIEEFIEFYSHESSWEEDGK